MKVNFLARTLELSAKELRQASNPDSREYAELLRVTRDLPDFRITVKQSFSANNANRGLTYNCMEQHIAQHAPEMMKEFHLLRTVGGYPKVTKWFRTVFPEYSNVEGLCSSLHTAA